MSGGGRLDRATLRLVAVIDSLRGDGIDGVVGRAIGAVNGGATMLQLRLNNESARTQVEVAIRLRDASPGIPIVVNGRADVALAAESAGVHLGPDDLAPVAVRPVVPDGFIIGASITDAASSALPVDADYAAVGPVGAGVGGGSPGLGLDQLAALARAGLPLLVVGGVTLENAAAVLTAGASGVAVLSGMSDAAGLTTRVRAFRSVLDASGR